MKKFADFLNKKQLNENQGVQGQGQEVDYRAACKMAMQKVQEAEQAMVAVKQAFPGWEKQMQGIDQRLNDVYQMLMYLGNK